MTDAERRAILDFDIAFSKYGEVIEGDTWMTDGSRLRGSS